MLDRSMKLADDLVDCQTRSTQEAIARMLETDEQPLLHAMEALLNTVMCPLCDIDMSEDDIHEDRCKYFEYIGLLKERGFWT